MASALSIEWDEAQPTPTVPAGFLPLQGWQVHELFDASKWTPELDTLRRYFALPTYEPSFHGDAT